MRCLCPLLQQEQDRCAKVIPLIITLTQIYVGLLMSWFLWFTLFDTAFAMMISIMAIVDIIDAYRFIGGENLMATVRFLVCNLAMADFFMGLYLGESTTAINFFDVAESYA